MEILMVDMSRTSEGGFATLHMIDLKSGKISSESYIGRKPEERSISFSSIANKMIDFLLASKPSKIIFNENGLGIGLKDAFKQEIKRYSSKVAYIEFNGDLIYNILAGLEE